MSPTSNIFSTSEIVPGAFTPERYHLEDENQRGSLSVGRRRYPLEVTELSACEFRGLIHPELAGKLTPRSTYTLRVLDAEWQVRLTGKLVRPDGMVLLDLEQVEEAASTDLPRRRWFTGSGSFTLSSNDPVVALAILVATVVTVMILPSLGGQWGTSQWVTMGIQSVWDAVAGLFRA